MTWKDFQNHKNGEKGLKLKKKKEVNKKESYDKIFIKSFIKK